MNSRMLTQKNNSPDIFSHLRAFVVFRSSSSSALQKVWTRTRDKVSPKLCAHVWERIRHLGAAGDLSPYKINLRNSIRHRLFQLIFFVKFDRKSSHQLRSKLYSTRRPMTVGTDGKLQ